MINPVLHPLKALYAFRYRRWWRRCHGNPREPFPPCPFFCEDEVYFIARMTELPPLALSVRQPWAWAIIYAGKDIENRLWGASRTGAGFASAAAVYEHAVQSEEARRADQLPDVWKRRG